MLSSLHLDEANNIVPIILSDMFCDFRRVTHELALPGRTSSPMTPVSARSSIERSSSGGNRLRRFNSTIRKQPVVVEDDESYDVSLGFATHRLVRIEPIICFAVQEHGISRRVWRLDDLPTTKYEEVRGLVQVPSGRLLKMPSGEAAKHATYASDMIVACAPFIWDSISRQEQHSQQRYRTREEFDHDLWEFDRERFMRVGLADPYNDEWEDEPRDRMTIFTKSKVNKAREKDGDEYDEDPKSHNRSISDNSYVQSDGRLVVRSIVVCIANRPRH